MNNFIVNKNSFHYKLNYFMKCRMGSQNPWQFEDRLPADFCSYWRMTFFSALWLTIFLLGVGLLATAITIQVITAPLVSAIVVGSGLAIVGFIIAMLYLSEYLKDSAERKREYKKTNNIPDGIITTKYKSWKQKYCPRVEYK